MTDDTIISSLRGVICGVDEAGRGPLAGDVYAAAVILPEGYDVSELDDSKRLTACMREKLASSLHAHATISIAYATVEEIDTLNILHATMLAMHRAIAGLPVTPDHALIDGNRIPDTLPCAAHPIIGGDGLYACISAASIIAKTSRDAAMLTLDAAYPHYGFAQHKGYGTRAHRDALLQYGPTQYHRHSFRPVRDTAAHHALAPHVKTA